MSDGSLASLVEIWIRDALRALPALADRNVGVFEGTTNAAGQPLIEELIAGKSSPMIWVLFEDDTPRPLQEGQQAYRPTYGIYIVVKNARPGLARTGDETTLGTNGLRDLLRNALHDQSPNLSAGGFWTDQTEFRGVRVVFQRKDMFVQRAEVVVRETPGA